MSKKWKMLLMSAGAVAALSAGSALYAQADKPQSSGTMMHGGSAGMMDMMGQMDQMMDSCNKMMQDMTPSKGTDKPAVKPGPEKSK